MSGNIPHRTPLERFGRKLFGLAAITLIIVALWNIPYNILREERFRLFGESMTTGVVTEIRSEQATSGERLNFIEYKYVDNDGLARWGSARLPEATWKRFRPGSLLQVLYAKSRPDLARIQGEMEPPFQIWLRNLLR
ncbi:DUF3592 domain-containing protein [Pseudodesulfovibrio piezophilus]|uniref:DUF3592 domain-containing protein n=1 Tax=Pseudodesulfovibrio piezophilus (strain DSM 21447 / JCM 15486 / C1TLV30) TaxID=1322246 RepID=M1WLX8_PSEP2|nr:DUF3592 domain-containing protein [Pseudodesulfovibrio piezophilus]CCH48635.1 conserved protein of unknown function [Pseudodesulfovibrio piezophilus C1TLV30]